MAKVLEMLDSSYYPTIKTLIGSVFDGEISQDLYCAVVCTSLIKCQMHGIMWLPKQIISDYVIFKFESHFSKALQEAQDIDLHLQPLHAQLSQLEKGGFPHFETFIPALFHTLFLIWSNCQSYQRPARIVVLLQELCNLLIEQVRILFKHL